MNDIDTLIERTKTLNKCKEMMKFIKMNDICFEKVFFEQLLVQIELLKQNTEKLEKLFVIKKHANLKKYFKATSKLEDTMPIEFNRMGIFKVEIVKKSNKLSDLFIHDEEMHSQLISMRNEYEDGKYIDMFLTFHKYRSLLDIDIIKNNEQADFIKQELELGIDVAGICLVLIHQEMKNLVELNKKTLIDDNTINQIKDNITNKVIEYSDYVVLRDSVGTKNEFTKAAFIKNNEEVLDYCSYIKFENFA